LTSSEVIVAGHERRLATLDPLLPSTHPLPEPRPDDVPLTVDGGVGIARCYRPDPESIDATWGAAQRHTLAARVAGRWTRPGSALRCCTTPG
jgi:hypothetical protein